MSISINEFQNFAVYQPDFNYLSTWSKIINTWTIVFVSIFGLWLLSDVITVFAGMFVGTKVDGICGVVSILLIAASVLYFLCTITNCLFNFSWWPIIATVITIVLVSILRIIGFEKGVIGLFVSLGMLFFVLTLQISSSVVNPSATRWF